MTEISHPSEDLHETSENLRDGDQFLLSMSGEQGLREAQGQLVEAKAGGDEATIQAARERVYAAISAESEADRTNDPSPDPKGPQEFAPLEQSALSEHGVHPNPRGPIEERYNELYQQALAARQTADREADALSSPSFDSDETRDAYETDLAARHRHHEDVTAMAAGEMREIRAEDHKVHPDINDPRTWPRDDRGRRVAPVPNAAEVRDTDPRNWQKLPRTSVRYDPSIPNFATQAGLEATQARAEALAAEFVPSAAEAQAARHPEAQEPTHKTRLGRALHRVRSLGRRRKR